MSLFERSWLCRKGPLQRFLCWLSRLGFLPARRFLHWKVLQEIRAYESRVEETRISAVLNACWQTGKPCLGEEDEDGNFVITICEEDEA